MNQFIVEIGQDIEDLGLKNGDRFLVGYALNAYEDRIITVKEFDIYNTISGYKAKLEDNSRLRYEKIKLMKQFIIKGPFDFKGFERQYDGTRIPVFVTKGEGE